jgi:hypothetical protein
MSVVAVVVLAAVTVCQVWLMAAADTTMVGVWWVVVGMAVATVNTAVMGLQLLVVMAVAWKPTHLRA